MTHTVILNLDHYQRATELVTGRSSALRLHSPETSLHSKGLAEAQTDSVVGTKSAMRTTRERKVE
jgi:hypothetical protein